MRIHTLDNTCFELNTLPEQIDDLRFAILDNSNPDEPDFKYIPLIFLESFTSPALVLKIGDQKIKMPVDWQVIIGEEEVGDLETLPLTSINDRDFNVFEFNSRTSFSPTFLPIEIVDVYSEVNWYAPKLKNGQFLAVPIDDGDKPRVVYFIKDISRNCEVIDYGKLW
jgi:hypothetical protein